MRERNVDHKKLLEEIIAHDGFDATLDIIFSRCDSDTDVYKFCLLLENLLYDVAPLNFNSYICCNDEFDEFIRTTLGGRK